MRRTRSDFSTKHKKYRRETENMITTAQANMSSSNSLWQVSTVRNGNNNHRTQTSIKGMQTFNEQILQEINSVFINNEQGIIIRQVIELTRKGKINQHNSFDFPIKVIDPKCTERITVEFWKLASEILGSSANIYDKRVDNLSTSSNKIMDQLLRIKDNTVSIQQSVNKSYSKQKSVQRSKKLNISAESLKISINEIEFFNTEFTEKLNFNQIKKDCFKAGLLLNSKGIDHSNTSGLMLNILEIGYDLRIELHREQGILDEFYIQEKIKDSQGLFDNYIGQNFGFLTQAIRLKSFAQIRKYKDKHIVASVNEQSYQQIFQSISMSNQVFQRILQPLNINPQQSSLNQLLIHNLQSDDGTSHNLGLRESKYSLQSKQLLYRSLNTNLEDKKESLMIAGPWDMQFKLMKLQKKSRNKNISKESKKSSVTKNELQISFTLDFPQFRNEIFNKKIKKSQKILQSIIYEEKYLLAKAINPHIQIQNQRKRRQRVKKQIQNQETEIRQRQQTIVDWQSAFLKGSLRDNIQSPQDPQNVFHDTKENKNLQQQNSDNFCQKQIKSMSTIRQIKQLIYMHLMRQASLKISQFQCGLSPAGMLVMFLHLANQKNLQIQSIDNGFDTQLFIAL